jgi:hypothetical protein
MAADVAMTVAVVWCIAGMLFCVGGLALLGYLWHVSRS